MRAALKIALAVAVLGAGWAAMQQDDGVELAASDQRGGRDRSRDRAGPSNGPSTDTARRGERSDRPAPAARAASGVALAAAPWTDAALSEGVQAWRLRTAESEALPPPRPMTKAAPSAWASMAPPPPPPVKVAAAPPPPPPMAPRFPHAWIGRVNDETVSAAAAQAPAATPAASAASAAASAASAPVRVARPIQRAVLAGPVATWVVKEGDVIEGQWRVDRIQDRSMSLTYLPLQQSQTVSMK
ncbi:MAG: hypothetical protein IIA02_12035 [Proteobacteria bacterium]|uniref:hypothetical protein n=1 Tax=Aquabacterium sp. TaxID=1872578 RepID=UPI0035C6F6F8|nr:hypothetical protein [Pseudomonadota bacterium]